MSGSRTLRTRPVYPSTKPGPTLDDIQNGRFPSRIVRELAEDRYSTSGRPSIDPEVFFRSQPAMFHEGIHSERELMRIVSSRFSTRWYVRYDLDEQTVRAAAAPNSP